MKKRSMLFAMMAVGASTWGAGAARAQDVLPEIERAQGFRPLFDGTRVGLNRNFVDYIPDNPGNALLPAAWKVDSSLAVVTDGTTYSDIRSVEQYGDFEVRFDYRNPGDGGFYYRFTVEGGAPWETGLEFAIDDNPDNCLDCAGAALGLYGPVPLAYIPYAEDRWNRARVVVIGDSVEHWLNGIKVVGFRYHSEDFWARFDQSRWAGSSVTLKVRGDRKGGPIEKGYIGFQSNDGSRWRLRNIRINETLPRFGPDRWWSAGAAASAAPSRRRAAAAPVPRPGILRSVDGRLFGLDGKAVDPGGTGPAGQGNRQVTVPR